MEYNTLFYKYKKYKQYYKQLGGSRNNKLREVFRHDLTDNMETIDLDSNQIEEIMTIFENAYSREILGYIPNKKERAKAKVRQIIDGYKQTLSTPGQGWPELSDDDGDDGEDDEQAKPTKKTRVPPVVFENKRERALDKVREFVRDRAARDTRTLGTVPDTFSEDDEPVKSTKTRVPPVVFENKRERALDKVRRFILDNVSSDTHSLETPSDIVIEDDELVKSTRKSEQLDNKHHLTTISSQPDEDDVSLTREGDSSLQYNDDDDDDLPLSQLVSTPSTLNDDCYKCNNNKKFPMKKECCQKYQQTCKYTSKKQCHPIE